VPQSRSEEATEEPTPRRLAEARSRGEVAFSRELTSAAGLLAAVLLLDLSGSGIFTRVLAFTRVALTAASRGGDPGTALAAGVATMAWTLAPVLGAAMLAALAVGLGQTRGLVMAPLRADFARVLSASSRRLGGGMAAREGGRALLKVGIIAVLCWLTLRPVLHGLVTLTGSPPPRLLHVMGMLTVRLGVPLVLASLAFGIVDYMLALRRHRRSLRMTRREVKRDDKESEGDPAHRGERQRLHRDLLEQRMLDEVRKADFVVVDPQHLAVALRYDPFGAGAPVRDGAAAPVVVAKGRRLVAERIKQIARLAGVPIFPDVPLARALDELGEGGEIPAALYEPVAEILRVVEQSGVARTGSASRMHALKES
jgi:flagellar biosynthesis protein FlhB